jgi:hypothetical protein
LQQARNQLEKILSDPEFGRQNDQAARGADLTFPEPDWNFVVPQEVTWASWTVVAIFLGIILFWLIRTGWMLTPVRMRTKKEQAKANPRTEWMEQAARLAGQGEYRLAIRTLFHGVLESAHERRKLLRTIGKTNGDYRREIERNWPEGSAVFRELSTVFDDVWYGNKPVDGGDYTRYRSRSQEFAEMRDPDEA